MIAVLYQKALGWGHSLEGEEIAFSHLTARPLNQFTPSGALVVGIVENGVARYFESDDYEVPECLKAPLELLAELLLNDYDHINDLPLVIKEEGGFVTTISYREDELVQAARTQGYRVLSRDEHLYGGPSCHPKAAGTVWRKLADACLSD